MKNELLENISTIFQFLLKGVIFGILPFLLFMMITSRTPLILGIRSFVILTGSMQPTLPVGSVIFTQNFPTYQTGDIVAFKSGDVTVTHRIIDFETKDNNILYKTQGDANNTPDSQLIPQEKILGKVYYHLPYLGKLTMFLKTMPGFLALIVFPAFVFIIFEIVNIKNELTKEIEKKLMKSLKPNIGHFEGV